MSKLLEISNEELELVIQNTADKLNMSKAIVEKDLWVCMILKYLFSKFKYRDAIIFKGGTSLSKVYKLIERFSEDIDLALDWKVLGYGKKEPYEDRSNTKQLKFNDKINKDTKVFLRNEFLPVLQNDFKEILEHKTYSFYIEEMYPEVFDENIEVVAVDSLRTFFEKITILHREANRVNGNYPKRYSRHFYDIYKMILTDIREKSFENIELLKSVINFKKKFYASNWAKYDDIMNANLKLIPLKEGLEIFSKDYDSMKNMLFGEKIPFDKIINTLKEYEKELNFIIKNKYNFGNRP